MATATRRSFLGASLGLASAGILPGHALGAMRPIYGEAESQTRHNSWNTRVVRDSYHSVDDEAEPEMRLHLEVARTGEVFNDVYRKGSMVYLDALDQVDYLLRDWRRDEVIAIDRDLIDLIANIQSQVGYEGPLRIVSGYRTRATNDMLRRKRRGAAKNSYHIKGMAADISFRGVSRSRLRQLALKMHAGGVGYYPRSGFIHVDTGPVRTWRG